MSTDTTEKPEKRKKKDCMPITHKIAAHVKTKVKQLVDEKKTDVNALLDLRPQDISLDTQLSIANALRGAFDPTAPSHLQGWSVNVGLIDLKNGGLKVKVWTKDLTDLSKETGVMLNFQLVDF